MVNSFLGQKLYRVGKAASNLGVTVQTLKNWIYAGKIQSLKTAGGEHRIPESEIKRILGIKEEEKKNIIYARVSSRDQAKDLETQLDLLESFVIKNGHSNIIKMKDIGSGINPKRKELLKLFKMVDENEISNVFITYKDRLTRFGFGYLEHYFNSHGVTISIINDEEVKDPQKELVDDLIAIVTSFSGKIYGMRSHKSKKIVEAVKKEVE
jgi:excisionase family DNA binding protein